MLTLTRIYISLFAAIIVLNLITACSLPTPVDDKTNDGRDLELTGLPTTQESLPTITVTPVALPTNLFTATKVVNTHVVLPTSTPMLPAPTQDPMQNLGRIYEVSEDGIYAWISLEMNQENMNISHDLNMVYASDDLSSPANKVNLAFSHYSEIMAYWALVYPGELWISDIHYQQPRLVFTDTNGIYINEETQNSMTKSNLSWSPDDQHLFIYTSQSDIPHLRYDVRTHKIENWYWQCQTVIISPQTKQLAVLCSVDNNKVLVPDNQFAVLEWGGDIWYTSEQPEMVISEPLSDGTIPWQFSANGKKVAYFDPYNPSLIIRDAEGNVQELLKGQSLLQQDKRLADSDAQYYEAFLNRDLGFFRWSQDNELLLVYALGSINQPCRQLTDVLTGELYEEPCWQVIDLRTGEILWGDIDSASTLFEDEFERNNINFTQAVFAPNSWMIAIYGQYFDTQILAAIDLNSAIAYHLSSIPYPQIYWAGGAKENDG